MPQNNHFCACFGVLEKLNLFRLNFAVPVNLYFAHFLQMKMVVKLQSRGKAWNQVFRVRNAVFYKITKLFWEKVTVIKY